MLNGWENFFIVGATAGATLIGLLFVALTVGADLRRRAECMPPAPS